MNLPRSAPLLSWFIEHVSNRSGLGTGCEVQNLNFLCVCTPLCLQHSKFHLQVSSGFGWLSGAKGCWKQAPLLYLDGVNQRTLIFTDCLLSSWFNLIGVKRQLGQASREELESKHPPSCCPLNNRMHLWATASSFRQKDQYRVQSTVVPEWQWAAQKRGAAFSLLIFLN